MCWLLSVPNNIEIENRLTNNEKKLEPKNELNQKKQQKQLKQHETNVQTSLTENLEI